MHWRVMFQGIMTWFVTAFQQVKPWRVMDAQTTPLPEQPTHVWLNGKRCEMDVFRILVFPGWWQLPNLGLVWTYFLDKEPCRDDPSKTWNVARVGPDGELLQQRLFGVVRWDRGPR